MHRWRQLSNFLSNFHPQSNESPRVEEGGPQPGVLLNTKGLLHLQGTMKASAQWLQGHRHNPEDSVHTVIPIHAFSTEQLKEINQVQLSLRNTNGIRRGERNRIHLPVRTSVSEQCGAKITVATDGGAHLWSQSSDGWSRRLSLSLAWATQWKSISKKNDKKKKHSKIIFQNHSYHITSSPIRRQAASACFFSAMFA